MRAFSAGLQEFIEAFTYCNYVREEAIIPCSKLQLRLTYQPTAPDASSGLELMNADRPIITYCLVDPTEYLLGIGDLSGEIMRKSIFALGIGDFATCFVACRFLRSLYAWCVNDDIRHLQIDLTHILCSIYFICNSFIGIPGLSKSLNCKIATLRQSLQKVEMVCYNIKVRGREAIRSSIGPSDPTNEDEGFAND